MQINIGFGINDEYCQHCAVTMASILVNSDKNDEYNFYIAYDKLSENNVKKLKQLEKIRDFNIIYIQISQKEFENLFKKSQMHHTSFNRFKFFQLEDVDKILYLDSDVIVLKDIKTLYNTNLYDYCIAGAKDILWKTLKSRYNLSEKSIYINAGVMLINTKETRKMDFTSYISTFLRTYGHLNYSDQDLINYIFQEKILEFDIKYNYCYPYQTEYDESYYTSIASDPSIVHYITQKKPWAPGIMCFMKTEYFKYLMHTPYYYDFMPLYQIAENATINSKLDSILKRLFVE